VEGREVTQISGEVHNYDEEYPSYLGPPRVVNGTGGKLLDATTPTYLLQIDAGAFRAVWELLEAEARHRFPTRSAISGVRAYLRAVEAFRKCYWSNHESPEPPEPVRKLVRKSGRPG
jgi:hypothetical protein